MPVLALVSSALIAIDTLVVLPDVEISCGRDAYTAPVFRQAQQVTVTPAVEILNTHAIAPKDVAVSVPNMVMPDYGSAMTSSVYIRGIGSRIDEPVMGMVVDGIPLLDKNLYDFRLQDVRNVEVMLGPQGTLYGRNTMGGIMEINTMLPLDVGGQKVSAYAGYGSANSVEGGVFFSRCESDRFGWSASAIYDRTDGFYTNQYTNKRVDYGHTAGGRIVLDGKPSDNWRLTNIMSVNWVDQGAYPYASAQSGVIAYNHKGAYNRLSLMAAARAVREGRYTWQLSASYQFMRDRMQMDNDYTPASIFTLEQKQLLHGATLDALVRNKDICSWYGFQTGFSAFLKHGTMAAPVTFMRDGIEELILKNANAGIKKAFPKDSLEIDEREFVVGSDFLRLNAGAAIYHQSEFRPLDNLIFRVGLRADVEYVSLDYDSRALVHYRMTALMPKSKAYECARRGNLHDTYLQLLPRVSVQYNFEKSTIYAYAAKGSKAGGFNTQMFSTIIQNSMMFGMMDDMGVHLDGVGDERYTRADVTTYRPESAWTYEIGTHYIPVKGLRLDADVFYMSVKDMQVTVFPEGKTTGRMMANAAKARSFGVETSLRYSWQKGNWSGVLHASYGFTDARFVSFNDGRADYSGNHIPYAPAHTMSALFNLSYNVDRKWLRSVSLTASANGCGQIWWNEQNTMSQPFYALMNLSVELKWKHVRLLLWSKNLTGTEYDVFYFVSMDNAFLQRGKPRQLGVQIGVEF